MIDLKIMKTLGVYGFDSVSPHAGGVRGLMVVSAACLTYGFGSGALAGETDGKDALGTSCVSSEVLGVGLTNLVTSPMTAIDVAGDFAYVLDVRHNMIVFDISDLTLPVMAGSVSVGHFSAFNWNVCVVDGLAYLAHGGDGFDAGGVRIFDVSDPSSIVQKGLFESPGSINIEVADSVGYLMNNSFTVQFIDLVDPENPVLIGSYSAPNIVFDVEVINGIAYMATQDSGLIVVDVSDAQQPVVLGDFMIEGISRDIEVVGSIAYIANDDDGLVMIDVHDPAQLAMIQTVEIDYGARRVSISDGIAHVMSPGEFGVAGPSLWSIGVANPNSPELLGIYQDDDRGLIDVQVRDETAFFAVQGFTETGMMTLDVTNLCDDGCRADLNDDGVTNFFDVSLFLDSMIDFDGNGEFNFFDISDFLGAYAVGCP